jgi:hypothetical protein
LIALLTRAVGRSTRGAAGAGKRASSLERVGAMVFVAIITANEKPSSAAKQTTAADSLDEANALGLEFRAMICPSRIFRAKPPFRSSASITF